MTILSGARAAKLAQVLVTVVLCDLRGSNLCSNPAGAKDCTFPNGLGMLSAG